MGDPAQRSGNGGGKKISFLYNSVTTEDRKKIQLVELPSIYVEKLLHLKFFDSYNCLEVMGLKSIFTPPPASLTISISPLVSKIERKFQFDELLPIYAEKLLYLNFFDSYNCLEVMS